MPPTVKSVQSSDFYRPRISNQPIYTGKCMRSMEERWVIVWFDDGVGNLRVVEITCTTTNAAVAPASWFPISYSRLRWKSAKTDASPSRIWPNFFRMCHGKLCTGLWLKICIFGNCARWIPKNYTPEHKTKRMGSALSFLERYEKDSFEFLTHILTGDETWESHVIPERKQ